MFPDPTFFPMALLLSRQSVKNAPNRGAKESEIYTTACCWHVDKMQAFTSMFLLKKPCEFKERVWVMRVGKQLVTSWPLCLSAFLWLGFLYDSQSISDDQYILCTFKLNPAQRALPTQVEAFWDSGLPPSLGGGREGDATTASWFTPLVNITSGW